MPPMPKAKVELVRILQLANPLLVGKDVERAQRLLTKNKYENFQPGTIDGEFGEQTAGAVKRAKYALGYEDKNVNESYGERLAGYLSGARLDDAYSKRRQTRLANRGSEDAIRARIVANALWGVEHTAQIDYDQTGPRLAGLGHQHMLPLTTDCSAFTTLCYNWADAPNPNGGPYNPKATVYTGTMLAHTRQIPQSAVKPGDMCIWTPPSTGQHVCIAVTTGSDPWLVSHGSDRGPLRLRFSDEHHYQVLAGHAHVSWHTVFPG
jgi:hypothetical protein